MSLYDHVSPYLARGWYDVRIDAVRCFFTPGNTEGVEFTVVDDKDGKSSKASFYITPKAVHRLAKFAQACGATDEDLKAYDEHSEPSHRTLINRRARVFVDKDDKGYFNVQDWEPIGSDSPAPVAPSVDRSTPQLTPEVEAQPDPSIPF